MNSVKSKSNCCPGLSFIPNPVTPLLKAGQVIKKWASDYFSKKKSYSETELTEINTIKEKVLKKSRGKTTEDLSQQMTGIADMAYKSWQKESENQITAVITKTFTFFQDNEHNKDKLINFIVDTVGVTLVSLLENEEPTVSNETPKKDEKPKDSPTSNGFIKNFLNAQHQKAKDILNPQSPKASHETLLLEALIDFLMPEKEANVPPFTERANNAKGQFIDMFAKVGRFFTTMFKSKEPDQNKSEQPTAHFDNLPDWSKDAIRAFCKENTLDHLELACYTSPFNSKGLLKACKGKDSYQSYVTLLLKLSLKEHFNTLLNDPSFLGKVATLFSEAMKKNSTGSENDQIKDLVNKLLPIVFNHVANILPKLFSGEANIVDQGVEILSGHLESLAESQWDPGTLIDKKYLDHLEQIVLSKGNLSEKDASIAKVIWGEDYKDKKIDSSEPKLAFLNKYPDGYSIFVKFRKQDTCHPSIKNNQRMSDHLGHTLAHSMDELLNDTFLNTIFDELPKNALFKTLNIETSDLKKLSPFVKFMARFYVHHLITDPKDGFFNKVEELLSPKNLESTIANTVLPSAHDALLGSLVETVFMKNIDQLAKMKETNAGDFKKLWMDFLINEVKGVYTEVHEETLKTIVETSCTEIQSFIQEIENSKTISTKSPRALRQSLDEFFKQSKGMTNPIYGEIFEKLLFDFSDSPWFIRLVYGFLNFFISIRGYVSDYISSALKPYRETHTGIAKVIHDQLDHLAGNQEKMDDLFRKLFNNEQPHHIDKKNTVTLDASIQRVSKLVFITATYKSSFVTSFLMRATLGSYGSKLSEKINKIVKKILLKATPINQSLMLHLIDKTAETTAEIFKSSTSSNQNPSPEHVPTPPSRDYNKIDRDINSLEEG